MMPNRKDNHLASLLTAFLSEKPDLIQDGLEAISCDVPLPGNTTIDLLCKDRKTGRFFLVIVKTDRRSASVRKGKTQLVERRDSIRDLLGKLGFEPPGMSLIEVAYNGKKTYIFKTDGGWRDGDNERVSHEIGDLFSKWVVENRKL